MQEMMRRCGEWMASLGWAGMLLGAALLVTLIVLVVMLIGRTGSGSRP